MTQPLHRNLIQLQHQWLERFGSDVCVDLHCHCLPGLDDGPQNMEEALCLCKALVSQGITTVIATPHQLGRFDGCYDVDVIRCTTSHLNTALQEQGIPLDVLPGSEIRVDERICALLKQGHLLTMGDQGRFVLLELPYDLYLNLEPLLAQISELGLRAIIAHPERNKILALEPERIRTWADYDPIIQITGASLLGRFGPTIQQASFHFLDMPSAKLVATDAHDCASRGPCVLEAFDMIVRDRGKTLARQLFIEEPLALIGALNEQQTENVEERRAWLS